MEKKIIGKSTLLCDTLSIIRGGAQAYVLAGLLELPFLGISEKEVTKKEVFILFE